MCLVNYLAMPLLKFFALTKHSEWKQISTNVPIVHESNFHVVYALMTTLT